MPKCKKVTTSSPAKIMGEMVEEGVGGSKSLGKLHIFVRLNSFFFLLFFPLNHFVRRPS